jgi:hypothetical protein
MSQYYHKKVHGYMFNYGFVDEKTDIHFVFILNKSHR